MERRIATTRHADIYVYDGGRFYEVVIGGETFHATNETLDQLIESHGLTGETRWRNGCPPGFWGDYSRECWRNHRPVPAFIDRPCCEPVAEEIYTWWDEINKCREDEKAL